MINNLPHDTSPYQPIQAYMTAHFKNNILTVTSPTLQSISYTKDGDKWRQMPSMKMVTYDEHLMLNKIMEMASGAKKQGRVIKVNGRN